MNEKYEPDAIIRLELQKKYQAIHEPDRSDLLYALYQESHSFGLFDEDKCAEVRNKLIATFSEEKQIFINSVYQDLEAICTTNEEKMTAFVDLLCALELDNVEHVAAIYILHLFGRQPGIAAFLDNPKDFLRQCKMTPEIKSRLRAIAQNQAIFSALADHDTNEASLLHTKSVSRQEGEKKYYSYNNGLFMYAGIAAFKKFPETGFVDLGNPADVDLLDTIVHNAVHAMTLVLTGSSGSSVGIRTQQLAQQYLSIKMGEIDARTNKVFPVRDAVAIVEFLTPSHKDPTWSHLTGNSYSLAKTTRDMAEAKIYIVSTKPPEQMFQDTVLKPSSQTQDFVCFDREDALYVVKALKVRQLIRNEVQALDERDLYQIPSQLLLEIVEALYSSLKDKDLKPIVSQFMEVLHQNRTSFSSKELEEGFRVFIASLLTYIENNPFHNEEVHPVYVALENILAKKLEYSEAVTDYQKLYTDTICSLANVVFVKNKEWLHLILNIEAIHDADLHDDEKHEKLKEVLIQAYHDLLEENAFVAFFKLEVHGLTDASALILALKEIFNDHQLAFEKKPAQNKEALQSDHLVYSFFSMSKPLEQKAQDLTSGAVLNFIDHIRSKMTLISSFSPKWDLIDGIRTAIIAGRMDASEALLLAMEVFATPRSSIVKADEGFTWNPDFSKSPQSMQKMLKFINKSNTQIALNIRHYLVEAFHLGHSAKEPLSTNELHSVLTAIAQNREAFFDPNKESPTMSKF